MPDKPTHRFRIGEAEYRFRPLSAAEEFHCVRRIGPIVANTGALVTALAEQPEDDEAAQDRLAGLVQGAAPLLQAFAGLSEADADYVMTRCLGATEAKRGEDWVPAWDADAEAPALPDLRMTDMLRISYEVLREAVSAFFFDAASHLAALGLVRRVSAP